MGELRELLEHADFEELVTLLLYGPDTENRDMDNYEKEIENGYTDAFAQVEKILADEEPDRMDRIRSVFYALGQSMMIYILKWGLFSAFSCTGPRTRNICNTGKSHFFMGRITVRKMGIESRQWQKS